MKAQYSFIQELSKKKYLSYIHSLPQFKKEQTEAYLMIILVIFAVLFFGIFAIMPTLSTIAQLRKDLEDSIFVNTQLEAKIANMSQLRQQYSLLSPNLPVLHAAIPETSQAPLLIGQIQALGEKAGVTLTKIQVQEIPPSGGKSTLIRPFSIIVDSRGDYANLQSFYNSLITFERILTIESMTITRNQEDGFLQLSIKLNAYFQP